MKFICIIAFAVLFSSTCYSQEEKCSTSDESIIDPNSITKCSIEDVKKTLEDIKTNKKTTITYHKKRKRVSSNGLTSTNTVNTEVKNNTQLVSKLELKKDEVGVIQKIPFHLVEKIPLFKKNKGLPLVKQAKCFEQNMAKHVAENFNYPKEAIKNRTEGRILAQFTIDENGDIVDIQIKGRKGTEILKEAANNIISKLPKLISGKHNGKKVKVKYDLPLTFKLPKS